MTLNIGTGPSDIPLNSYLGNLAFADDISGTKHRVTIEVERGTQVATSALKFIYNLPDVSSLYKITGSFYFDGGSGNTYKIWGDYGFWDDAHAPILEGFKYVLKNDATAADYNDSISGRYFMIAEPVDAAACTVDFEMYVRTKAFNQGQRPGVWGTLRYTYSGIGNALSIFSYQDISASGSDVLSTFALDIDAVNGNPGGGYCSYVIEALPIIR